MLVVHQEVDQCAVAAEAEELQEDEVDSAAIVVAAVSVAAAAHQEVEDLEHAVGEADSAEVHPEGVDSAPDEEVSAVVEEVEPLLLRYCTLSSWRWGTGMALWLSLFRLGRASWTIPSVYEKRYVVSKLEGDDGMLILDPPALSFLSDFCRPDKYR